jgi:hypothetical protein
MNEQVSFVITSCGRVDLLQRTIESFIKYNTYPISEFIIIDDSLDLTTHEFINKTYGTTFKIILNKEKLGQIKSIDKLYSLVKTSYIFHCEDDWEFFRGGFIEDSLSILKENQDVICIWLRDLWDTNNHPVSREILTTKSSILYRELSRYFGCYGFSFNPGLRRLKDYQIIAPFNKIGHEVDIGLKYEKMNYHAVILEQSAVEHIGWERHVIDNTIMNFNHHFLQKIRKKIIKKAVLIHKIKQVIKNHY